MAGSPRYALLPLELVEGALRLAASRRIRLPLEFVGAYRDVNGEGSQLSDAWMRRRSSAIQSEIAQHGARGHRPTTWTLAGAQRSRQAQLQHAFLLRLAAWGFSPEPQALRVYLRNVGLLSREQPEIPPRATV